jgi:hypothetical protein
MERLTMKGILIVVAAIAAYYLFTRAATKQSTRMASKATMAGVYAQEQNGTWLL